MSWRRGIPLAIIASTVAVLYLRQPAVQPAPPDPTSVLDALNYRAMPPGAYRILFVGDSLTMVPKTPGLWDHAGGMAASRADRDFVHLVAAGVQAAQTRPVEVLIDNGGDGHLGSMLEYLRRSPDLLPDAVVIQGGENDPFDDAFRRAYRALLDRYGVKRIVLGDWWSADKSGFERAEAASRGLPFVDLAAIDADPAHSGDGGAFAKPDVARHPNDAGMRAIADGVIAAWGGR